MIDRSQPITKAGLKKIEKELVYMETVRRREVAEKIHQAKELSSTQNNAEYEDAKNEQAMVEGRIAQLQSLITNASIIDEAGAHKSKLVTLGSQVKVKSSDGQVARVHHRRPGRSGAPRGEDQQRVARRPRPDGQEAARRSAGERAPWRHDHEDHEGRVARRRWLIFTAEAQRTQSCC